MSTHVKRNEIYNLTKISLCVALLCVASYVVFPIPFSPIVLSLHTIMVNLIGLVLKPKQAALTVFLYLLMGLIGLPVFSMGASGPGKLFGPTGGYYFGFFFAVIAISLLKGRRIQLTRYILVTMFVGVPIQHVCAVLMMCMHNGFQLQAALLTISMPFLLGDNVKCVMASVVGVALNRALPQNS